MSSGINVEGMTMKDMIALEGAIKVEIKKRHAGCTHPFSCVEIRDVKFNRGVDSAAPCLCQPPVVITLGCKCTRCGRVFDEIKVMPQE